MAFLRSAGVLAVAKEAGFLVVPMLLPKLKFTYSILDGWRLVVATVEVCC